MSDKISEHFSRSEFACKCGKCGLDTVDAELVRILEEAREYFGVPCHVNSAARCPEHNAAEGGSKGSEHLVFKAADIRFEGIPADDVADYFENKYPGRYGIGRYGGRTHIDVRKGAARWDNRIAEA